jgi:two-component system nitrogen regulation response regulator GlnG
MKPPRVLIVEDEHALALALAATVRRSGAPSDLAASAARAGKLLQQHTYDLLILDIGLPDQNGLAFLESLAPDARPSTLVITAHGEIGNTISARKLGVAEFLTKPLDFDALQQVLARLLPAKRPRGATHQAPDTAAFIGAAPTMRPVFQQIAHCCASADPVLVRGETGSGKTHAAQVIRKHGPGHAGPVEPLFASPSVGPEILDQSLERSRGGVLIIEELGQLGDEAQAELVRQLESGRPLPRLIATSSEDLRHRVAHHTLRSDLFYRLQVLEVRLPPLRDRLADLPALVSYFLGRLEPDRTIEISDSVISRLALHDWPGNLRELRNALAYALTVSPNTHRIDEVQLPDHIARGPRASSDMGNELVQALDAWLDRRFDRAQPGTPAYRDLAETLEGQLIRRLLQRYEGKMARLSAALGANRTTLRQRLRKADLDKL